LFRPLLFRVVHRGVGVLEQRFHGGAVRGKDRNADARGNKNFMPVDAEGVRQCLQYPTGHPACVFRRRQGREQNGELIAAESREGMRRFVVGMPADRVALTNRLTQPFGHMCQQAVSHRVPQCIVDHLEPIQVDKQGGQMLMVAFGVGQGVGEAIFEQHTVGQARQAVVVCKLMDGPFSLFAFGDVLGGPDDRQLVRLFFAHPFGLEMNDEVGPVRQHDAVVDIAGRVLRD
jgi:hypothetical protein